MKRTFLLMFALLCFVVQGWAIDFTVSVTGGTTSGGAVYNGKLTAGTVTGVKSDGNLSLYGRSHKQLTEVYAKELYSVFCGGFGQFGTYFTLDGGINKTGVCILASGLHNCGTGGSSLNVEVTDSIKATDGVNCDAYL